MRAYLILLHVVMLWSLPQRNSPSQTKFTGEKLLDLLYDDATQDEYDDLLEGFADYLRTKELQSRDDFVDFEKMECTPKPVLYKVADPVQCDLYYECSTKGVLTEKLCEDGLVYDVPGHSCNFPARVECGERLDLQEPQPTPGCERLNGYFYFSGEPERCGEFNHCVNGAVTPGKCSTGVVWSPKLLSCTLPAQSGRQECIDEARKNEDFQCPVNLKGPHRFGNHDRLADPKDCGKFWVCLPNGTSNPASCDGGLAFDEAIGACQPIEDVEGCDYEDYETQEED